MNGSKQALNQNYRGITLERSYQSSRVHTGLIPWIWGSPVLNYGLPLQKSDPQIRLGAAPGRTETLVKVIDPGKSQWRQKIMGMS